MWGACMCGVYAYVGSGHVWGIRMCPPVWRAHEKEGELFVRDYADLKAHMHFSPLSFYLIHIRKISEWNDSPVPPRITDGPC